MTGASNFENGDLIINRWTNNPVTISSKGDLLITCKGTIGTMAYNNIGDIHIARQIMSISSIKHEIKYIQFFLDWYVSILQKKAKSIIPGISRENLLEAIVPTPPLREQQRIIDKIEKLLPFCVQFDIAQYELDVLNNDVYTLLKKSILQEAIQGHLVPQNPADEPAEELLKRIHKEKEKLVKEGKLKRKDVVESKIFIGEDNKYYQLINGSSVEIASDFEFPNSWEVVRLSDICRLTDGERKQGRCVCLDAKYLRGKSSGDFLEKGKFVTAGDNIILVDGENSGEVFTVPCDGYMGSTFKQLWVSNEMHPPYVLYFIQFYKDRLRNSKKGAAIPHLNKEVFYNLLIGIPPKAEQQRITFKIEELSRLVLF